MHYWSQRLRKAVSNKLKISLEPALLWYAVLSLASDHVQMDWIARSVRGGVFKVWADGIFPNKIKATFIIQDFGRQSLRVGVMTACICTARSFSLTHPTQLIHFQSPHFRRNSYPSCCSQRCSVDRQPTQNVHLTWMPATLEFAGISVCLYVWPSFLPRFQNSFKSREKNLTQSWLQWAWKVHTRNLEFTCVQK